MSFEVVIWQRNLERNFFKTGTNASAKDFIVEIDGTLAAASPLVSAPIAENMFAFVENQRNVCSSAFRRGIDWNQKKRCWGSQNRSTMKHRLDKYRKHTVLLYNHGCNDS